jgi:hypothetical protein
MDYQNAFSENKLKKAKQQISKKTVTQGDFEKSLANLAYPLYLLEVKNP